MSTRIIAMPLSKVQMRAIQTIAHHRPTSSSVAVLTAGRRSVVEQVQQLRRRTLSSSSSSSKNTATKLQVNNLHSSANHSKSATAAAALHVLESTQGNLNSGIPRPTFHQMKTLFITSSIPMVGFGFMDNFIMIQAGGYIDATIGVKFGLATMTAAAMGQVVSDVSGVVFGGTLERFLTRMNLMKASNLTVAQRQLPICKNIIMSGAVLGVMLGCCLGATSLLFIDTEIHERQKRAMELKSMLDAMLSEDEEMLGCEECTVYLADAEHIPKEALAEVVTHKTTATTTKNKEHTHSKVHEQHLPQMKLLQDLNQNTMAAKCALYKYAIVDNHYTPDNKEGGSSRSTIHDEDYQTAHSILCAPVISSTTGNVVAVLEFRNKYARHYDNGNSHNVKIDTSFTKEDEQTAKLFARHIAIFMDRLTTSE
mmetsp:Transcript_258/g.404  ORF Transcript_258/g.404 Transcript_258/m.404 type:complete len:424 (-) Transcript_258:452-1723(-)